MSIPTVHWNTGTRLGVHDVTAVVRYQLVMAQSAPSRGYENSLRDSAHAL